jgi:hypothetical protein
VRAAEARAALGRVLLLAACGGAHARRRRRRRRRRRARGLARAPRGRRRRRGEVLRQLRGRRGRARRAAHKGLDRVAGSAVRARKARQRARLERGRGLAPPPRLGLARGGEQPRRERGRGAGGRRRGGVEDRARVLADEDGGDGRLFGARHAQRGRQLGQARRAPRGELGRRARPRLALRGGRGALRRRRRLRGAVLVAVARRRRRERGLAAGAGAHPRREHGVADETPRLRHAARHARGVQRAGGLAPARRAHGLVLRARRGRLGAARGARDAHRLHDRAAAPLAPREPPHVHLAEKHHRGESRIVRVLDQVALQALHLGVGQLEKLLRPGQRQLLDARGVGRDLGLELRQHLAERGAALELDSRRLRAQGRAPRGPSGF